MPRRKDADLLPVSEEVNRGLLAGQEVKQRFPTGSQGRTAPSSTYRDEGAKRS